MPTPHSQPASGEDQPVRKRQGGLTAASPRAYVVIVLAAVLGAIGYSLRHDGLFSCQASGYEPDRYLAYCQAANYGDYDHGAFWFGLEPAALDAATNAEVIFVGNSRIQHAFSTAATTDWFSASSTRFFILGFSHSVNVAFEAPLLQKLRPRARVYVINTDRFFEQEKSLLAKLVTEDSSARDRYERKGLWQPVHRMLCTNLAVICGNEYVVFRSRATGAWRVAGGPIKNVPVSYDGPPIDRDSLDASTAAGKDFVASLPVDRECVILTQIPYVNTDVGTAQALASSLRLTLVVPQPQGLNTFDGGHLDRPSAERWSAAFFEAAGPRIRSCLSAKPDPKVNNAGPSDGAPG